MLSKIWLVMVGAAILFGAANGKLEDVGAASVAGAGAAVELCLSILGPICLWMGVTELLSRSGAAAKLSKLLNPVLKRLFPSSASKPELREKLGANITANILGLGNAATPLGMAAAGELGKDCANGVASREVCNLVIVNTASLQLIPATVASVRAALGSPQPFDIIPAVWLASAFSLAVGLTVGFICERVWKR